MLDRKQEEVFYSLECEINGEPIKREVPPSKRLLSILRDDLQMTGTKRSCEIGRCGACMILLNGKPVNACLLMAYQCQKSQITTIEGLSNEHLHPIQQAFMEEGGFQCGYCTPGMVISVKALLDENTSPSKSEIEEALSGNLCRCTGYNGIVRSVQKLIESGGTTS